LRVTFTILSPPPESRLVTAIPVPPPVRVNESEVIVPIPPVL
jgi:hypothetical protein